MSGDMPDVGDAVGKKIGPLPGWAWLLVVVGGAWGYKLYKGHSAGTSGPSPASLSTDPSAVANFAPGTGNAGGGIGFSGATGSVTQTPFGSPAAKTNAQWVLSTTDQMVAAGANPSAVSNALSTYVNGGKLDATAQSLVNQAITHYGSPPEGVIAVKTDTTVPLKQRYVKFISHAGDPTLYGITPEGQEIGVTYGEYAALGFPAFTTAAAHDVGAANVNQAHIYIVKDGDTLTSISQRFYGTSDTSKVRNANPGVSEHPGISTAVYVP